MKKQVVTISIVLVLAIALSLPVVLAGFFDDLFGKITGKPTSGSCSNPDTWYKDWDGDGYASKNVTSCSNPGSTQRQKKRWTSDKSSIYGNGGDDCVDDSLNAGQNWPQWKYELVNTDGNNDIADNINPGASEVCNFVDDNCKAGVDENFNVETMYADNDSDGYYNDSVSTKVCGANRSKGPRDYIGSANYSGSSDFSSGTVTFAGSSDQVSGNGPPEIFYNGSTHYFTNKSSSKGPDCNDSYGKINTTNIWYLDNDTDSYPGKSIQSCGNPSPSLPAPYPNHTDPGLSYVSTSDSNWYKYNVTRNRSSNTDPKKVVHRIFPRNVDCNDNDEDILNREDWYLDNDSDGYWSNKTKKCYNPGNKSLGSNSGNGPNTKSASGWLNSTSQSINNNHELVSGGDCNQGSKHGDSVNPGYSKDACDFNVGSAGSRSVAVVLDNDCDGSFDEDNDTDGDTYTTCGTRTNNKSEVFNFSIALSGSITDPLPTDNFTSSSGKAGWECNDSSSSTHRGAAEVCDLYNNDCNGHLNDLGWPDNGTTEKFLYGGPSESCVPDGSAVKEYRCDKDKGELISMGLRTCSRDTACSFGACRSCVDTDSSDLHDSKGNFTERGVTWNKSYPVNTGNGQIGGKEDTCLDTGTLVEYSCDAGAVSTRSAGGSGEINKTEIDCVDAFNKSYDKYDPNNSVDGFREQGISCVLGECVCTPDYKLVPGTCGADGKGEFEDINNCPSYPETKTGYCTDSGVVNEPSLSGLKIAGQPFDSSKDYSDSGVKSVMVNKSGNIARFDWNFSRILDLRSADIEVSDEDSDQGYLVINGLHVKKTVKIERVAKTDQVCLEDSSEVENVDDLSDGCNEDGEILVDCPGSNSGYSCNIINNGSHYEVSSLRHSGVKEFLNESGEDDDETIFNNSGGLTGDFDSGNSSQNLSKCTRRNYKCTGWSNCEGGVMTRNCLKVENCKGGVSRPETRQTCGVKGAIDQVTKNDEGFPWKLVLIVVGGLVVVLTIAIILVNMKSGGSSSKSRKSSSSSSSSSSTSGRNLTSSSSGSPSGSSSSSGQSSGFSNSGNSSSSENKGYFKRGISRKYQQRGRG